jgi:hypothetical protein
VAVVVAVVDVVYIRKFVSLVLYQDEACLQ